MITLPVSASMYQSMMANIQQIHTNSDGTVCITPMQVDANNTNNNNNTNSNANTTNTNNSNSNTCSNSNSSNSNSNSHNNNDDGNSNGTTNASTTTQVPQFQCYSIMAATPITAATAHHHRLLTANQALNQTQNLVNNLNINNSNSNNTNSSNSNNNNNINNIRCQIINASSLQQNSSQMNCQQQQNYLANVLQNATAKVFIANPTHLNLTNAANILNSNNNNNNNNDTTTANNNNNNNSNHNNNNQNGHIKIATAMPLPIVVATTTQHPQTMTIAAANAAATADSNNSRTTNSSNTTHSVSRKSGHKRRKQTFAKVLPIKVEEQLSTDANNTNNSSAENLLNIQIVNTADNSTASTLNVGGVVGNLRVGNRLVSVDLTNTGSQLPAKTIKLETIDN